MYRPPDDKQCLSPPKATLEEEDCGIVWGENNKQIYIMSYQGRTKAVEQYKSAEVLYAGDR